MSNLTDEARETYASLVAIPWQMWALIVFLIAVTYWLAKATEAERHPQDRPTPIRTDIGQDCGDTYQPGVVCRRPAGHPDDFHADGYGGTWPTGNQGAA